MKHEIEKMDLWLVTDYFVHFALWMTCREKEESLSLWVWIQMICWFGGLTHWLDPSSADRQEIKTESCLFETLNFSWPQISSSALWLWTVELNSESKPLSFPSCPSEAFIWNLTLKTHKHTHIHSCLRSITLKRKTFCLKSDFSW